MDSDGESVFVQGHRAQPEAPRVVLEASPDPDATFGLDGAMSVHGQKHIWDNISGDVLAQLQNFNQYKATRLKQMIQCWSIL